MTSHVFRLAALCFVVIIYVNAFVCSCCNMENSSNITANLDVQQNRQTQTNIEAKAYVNTVLQ